MLQSSGLEKKIVVHGKQYMLSTDSHRHKKNKKKNKKVHSNTKCHCKDYRQVTTIP